MSTCNCVSLNGKVNSVHFHRQGLVGRYVSRTKERLPDFDTSAGPYALTQWLQEHVTRNLLDFDNNFQIQFRDRYLQHILWKQNKILSYFIWSCISLVLYLDVFSGIQVTNDQDHFTSSGCKTLSMEYGIINFFLWTEWPPFRRRRFKCIFVSEKFCVLIQIPLTFVYKGPVDNNPGLV